jgi:hypothetical protein
MTKGYPVMTINIPLIDDQLQPQGTMWKSFYKYVRHIPRIGEELFLLPATSFKVVKVSYDGPFLSSISLTLEPANFQLREAFQHPTRKKSRNTSEWRWMENQSTTKYPSYLFLDNSSQTLKD